ncbi:LIM-domain-containing protein [Ophiocordyceps sinensis CO18]|uniref:LIM-domain-containing protein n=1 Tax=Ophiocordyceps sinensis (strain Co18 / CGMCC 3.14243) TaxID=911162 RepID=T5AMV3_OPHSC|nr:LIM-domain-containing protein [Ophiocordyceps sinensis CO18]
MALSKESGLTIKCSACGNQVEISKMGDHLCVGPMAELSPPPESKEQFDDGFSQPSYGTYGRTPPRVDTKAANRHFMDRGQLTPVSQPSESRNGSPIDDRPSQSPTKGYFSRSPTQAQQTGAYGGFGHRAARREPRESGSTKQGGGFFGRINAIAPGPFNNTSSRPPSERSAFPTRKESLEMWNGPSADDLARTVDRPGTSYSNLSGGSYTITIAPPKAARKNGYGGFGPPSTATNTLEPRSPGLPARSETSGYGHAENDGGYESHQRAGSGSRPGYGGGAGGLPGRNPGRPGPGSIRGAVPSGKRSLPDASVRPRPKMNKRMTRLGRM